MALSAKHDSHPLLVNVSNTVNRHMLDCFKAHGVTFLDSDTRKLDLAADKLCAAILNAIDAKAAAK